MAVLIRSAQPSDASSVAELCRQLGYEADEAEVETRLRAFQDLTDNSILVAESGDRVVGWAQMELRFLLVGGRVAELCALVVHESERGKGVGAKLMDACELWAKDHKSPLLRLKTRSTRGDAHRFYERLGYGLTKEQRVYERKL